MKHILKSTSLSASQRPINQVSPFSSTVQHLKFCRWPLLLVHTHKPEAEMHTGLKQLQHKVISFR